MKAACGRQQQLVAIKAPVFSMSKLTGVDTYLGPEMKSTGEVMGIDHHFRGGADQSAHGRRSDAASGRQHARISRRPR